MTAKPVMSIIAAKAALDAVIALIGTGSHLIIYEGVQPATTLTADSGTVGATLTMTTPNSFGASTNITGDGLATATAAAIASATAANPITAGNFRIKTSDGTTIMQGNCSTANADLILNTVNILAGDVIAITSFKATLPCGDGVS